jgi:hypothetical protein
MEIHMIWNSLSGTAGKSFPLLQANQWYTVYLWEEIILPNL